VSKHFRCPYGTRLWCGLHVPASKTGGLLSEVPPGPARWIAMHFVVTRCSAATFKAATRPVPEGPLKIARRFQRRVRIDKMEPRAGGTPESAPYPFDRFLF
jgi:hypothetical protein